MYKQLTSHQLRIVTHAERHFANLCPHSAVHAMYGAQGRSLSVGLAYREDGHNYIVRETIRWYSTKATIWFACNRLASTLGRLYAKTTEGPNLFAKLQHDKEGCSDK